MNILITAAGSGGTNGIISTLPKNNFTFIGVNSDYYKAAASNIAVTYQIAHASDEENYIHQLNWIIQKHNIELLIPNSDLEVEVVSKNTTAINAKTFLPDIEMCKIGNDKFSTYKLCLKNNINVPKSINAMTLEGFKIALEELCIYPLWCRIRYGSGSKFTKKVFSLEEAMDFIKNTSKEYNLIISDFLISEYLPGDDCLVFTIWHKGTLRYFATAHRMKYFGNQGQSAPTLIKKEYRHELFEMVMRLARQGNIQPHGIYNFDIKYDRNNNPAITEINIGRFYYNMPLFNRSSHKTPFEVYVDSANDLTTENTIISKEEFFFLRDQDNFPVVLSQEEISQKVMTVYED